MHRAIARSFPLYIAIFRIKILMVVIIAIFASVANADDKSIVRDINSYLNSMDGKSATFEQIDDAGQVQKGRVHIKRPNKMRWEYLAPEKYVIVVNHNIIMHYVYDLDEMSHISLGKSFLKMFCEKEIDVSRDAQIIEAKSHKGALSAKLLYNIGDQEALITISLLKNPKRLESISVEQDGKTINIFFYNMQDDPYKESLFLLKRPKARK